MNIDILHRVINYTEGIILMSTELEVPPHFKRKKL